MIIRALLICAVIFFSIITLGCIQSNYLPEERKFAEEFARTEAQRQNCKFFEGERFGGYGMECIVNGKVVSKWAYKQVNGTWVMVIK